MKNFLQFISITILVMIALAMLSGCSLFTKEKVIYSTVYPSLPPLESPNVLSLNTCQWEYPLVKDDKVFIGLDEQNFKCYIENKEIIREQMKLYENFVKEVNTERAEWNKLNNSSK